MRCIVTGGAGFIGSHIAERLLSEGHGVTIIDDMSAGYYENVPKDAALIQANIINTSHYENVLFGADVVFHNAASKKNICMMDPEYDLAVNGGGTLALLHACKKHGVKRFVHASTGSVYGEAGGVITEETQLNPVSYYGVSKLAGEKYVMLFKNDMHVSVLRYFHVYGDRQESDPAKGGVVAVFKKQIGDGGPVTIHGDGKQKRLFTSVHDVVDANLKCAAMNIPSGSVFNCASDRRISVMALAGMLIHNSGKKIVLEYQDPLPGDIWNFEIDNSKIKGGLGMEFRPFNP